MFTNIATSCYSYYICLTTGFNMPMFVALASELRWTSPRIATQSAAEGLRWITIAGEPLMWWCSTKRLARNLYKLKLTAIDWTYTRIKWIAIGLFTAYCANKMRRKLYNKYFGWVLGSDGYYT